MDIVATPIDLGTTGRPDAEPGGGMVGDDALARALASLPSSPGGPTTGVAALLPPPMPTFDPALHRPDPPVAFAQLHEDLALAALELAQLAEHHRRELSDTMAELTRLQRQVRAETRGAIEELRRLAAAESSRAHGAAPVDGVTRATDADSPTDPARRGLRGRLRLSRS